MEIYGDYEELAEMVKGLSLAEPTLKKATVSALNKTIVSFRAHAVKMIAKDYNLKQKDIRAELNIVRAKKNRLEARLTGAGSPGVPLAKFSPTPRRTPSTIHKKGIWEEVEGKRGNVLKRKRLKPGSDKYLPKLGVKVMVLRGRRKVIKGAFVARMSSGHVGVFRRAKDGRVGIQSRKTVIEELFGPSPLRILDGDKYQIPLDDFAAETLDKNMLHEAEFFLRREGVLPDV